MRSLATTAARSGVDAHFDKGVLHLRIKKSAEAIKITKTIDIQTGALLKKVV